MKKEGAEVSIIQMLMDKPAGQVQGVEQMGKEVFQLMSMPGV